MAASSRAGSITATTEAKREALERWNMVAICERFGWTPQEYRALPVDILHDIIAICGIRDAQSNSPSK